MDEKTRIKRAVSSVLDTNVELRENRDGTWRLAVLDVAGRPRFRAAWLRAGWPAEVREALDRFPDLTLAVAPVFSSGARELLKDRQVNWIDETGAANVREAGLLVRIDRGSAPADPTPRGVRWSDTSALAGAAMLVSRPEQISVKWIADHARCSPARASAILQGFDGEGWTVKRGANRGRSAYRTLEQPVALLDSWSDHINNRPVERWFAHSTTRDLRALQRRLGDALPPLTFGWTGWAAAEHLAPFVTQLPILHLRISESYARRDTEPALQQAGVTSTEEAGRIELWRTPQAALLSTTPSPAGPLVAWPWVYADLQRIGGRGRDAAEHLRDVMMDDHDR
ncbi:hypothetical protein [Baekduia sp.]|jgi:hypothetical protein|uniref:hypothetical protein n=1 Tax=Baekduia sp. TaxID=2600305 RepID=UPI002E04D15E|nr:hypothetical protein [Baekduia sp.]